MRGSEGGIPYHTQHRPITVHLDVRGGKGFHTPLCNTTAWRYQTSPRLDHVTCSTCIREVRK